MLGKWFKTGNLSFEEKVQEIMLKNSELENKLIQSNIDIEQIKTHLRDTQLSLQLVLSSYQGLAEEVSSLHDVLYAMMSPTTNKNSFRFSFRDSDSADDDDDDGSWN